jgi:tRNA(fMet)-specific endonuclease VapC
MLDTDTVSYSLRGYGGVNAQIVMHHPAELCMSAVTLAELRYGASHANARRLHRLIDGFVRDVAVMPFDESCAGRFGQIAADLAARGTPIGDIDAMIAAHALALDVTLVTNNVKHFGRIAGLHIENWV